MKRPYRMVAYLAASALMLSACGAASSSSNVAQQRPPKQHRSNPPSAGPTKVTLQLNYIPAGYHAPFYVALKKGFYKQEHLDVQIVPSTSQSVTLQRVSSGGVTFGLAGADGVVPGVNRGMSVRMVASYFQQTPLAFMFLANRHITRPSQLKGLTIGVTPGTGSAKMLPGFLAANGLKMSDVHVDSLSARVLPGLLATGKIDTYSAYAMTTVPVLAKKGVHVTTMSWAAHGVRELTTGLVATNKTIKQHPAEIVAFLKATAEGYSWSEQHPHSAVAIMRSMLSSGRVKLPHGATETLKLSFQLLHTSASAGHPLGWMAPSDWVATLKTLHEYANVKKVQPPTTYYSDAFVVK